MTFRDAVKADAKQYIAIRRAVLSESDFMLREPGEYSPSVVEAEAEIERAFTGPNSRIIVAESDGVLVGFLVAKGNTLRRLRHSTEIFMAVLKSFWGQGVARGMLREATVWAKATGLERLELSVSTENLRAIKLYEKAGFQIEGTRRRAVSIGGRLMDDHLMGFLCNTDS